MGEPKPRRQRKGILDTLTGTEGGFTGSNLTLISKQIADIQQGPPATPDVEIEPPPVPVSNEPEPPTPSPIAEPTDDEPLPVERRKRGARDEKPSGYHLRLAQIKSQGLENPLNSGSFTMTPHDDMLALLSLERLSVVQVVYLIMRETIGWEDPVSESGRREWVSLSAREIERRGIANRAQARRGLQRALDEGYIIRRESGNGGYEYSIRWKKE